MSLEAVVTFEYTAEQEDELTLKVGDIITNVEATEGGWCEGHLNGRKGMFPENFVKILKQPELPPIQMEVKREAPQRKSVRELASKFKDNLPGGGSQKKKEKQKKCKVLFEYTKENNDELDLAVGSIIEFHRQVEDGWWEGSINGKQGVFPSNFVEMLEETASVDEGNLPSAEDKEKPTADTQSKDADVLTIKGRKVVGVGLGNIFDGGPIKLRAVTDKKKEEAPKSARQEDPQPIPSDVTPKDKQNSTEQAVVRFAYTAEQQDELTLVEGQIVRILDKQLEDDGWWKGELNGKIGIFPDNFVELLPNEDTNKPKKPPPPVTAPTKSALPKLPEKTPISDTSHDKTATEPQMPFIFKKPQVPPASMKPVNQKSVESKPEPCIPHQQTNSAKDTSAAKDNHTVNHNSEGSTHFDDLQPASQKLTHLTFGRAQGPKKRPPSSVLVLNDAEKDEIVEEVKSSRVLPAPEKQPSRLPEKPDKPLPALPFKDYRHIQPPLQSDHSSSTPPPSSAATSVRDNESLSSTPPPRPPEPSKAPPSHTTNASTVQTSKLVEQLKLQLNELKTNSVSKTMFNELRIQHEKLKIEFESLKKSHAAKIRDLANEVDEEKKLRLTTQVEIERVKKFLADSHV